MASSTSNLMDSIENPNGRVSVKLQRNHFSKDSSDKYVGRAVRTHPIFPPKTENFSKVARRNPDNISTASYRRVDIQTPVIYVSFKNGKFH